MISIETNNGCSLRVSVYQAESVTRYPSRLLFESLDHESQVEKEWLLTESEIVSLFNLVNWCYGNKVSIEKALVFTRFYEEVHELKEKHDKRKS